MRLSTMASPCDCDCAPVVRVRAVDLLQRSGWMTPSNLLPARLRLDESILHAWRHVSTSIKLPLVIQLAVTDKVARNFSVSAVSSCLLERVLLQHNVHRLSFIL